MTVRTEAQPSDAHATGGESDDTTPTDAPVAPAVSTPAPAPSAPTPSEAPAPASGDARENDPAYWRQRFKVTQGLFDRERQDRRADRDRHRAEVDKLHDRISELERAQRSAPTAPQQGPDLGTLFTESQIEQYGEQQCRTIADVAMRLAREQAQSAVTAALAPIEERNQRAAERAAEDEAEREQQRRASLAAAIGAEVPDFQAIDESQEWRAWLMLDDPATGIVRQELVTRYVQTGNAQRLIAMLKAYKDEQHAPRAPTPSPTPARSGNGGGGDPVPTYTGGAPTAAEIRDFYKRAALGKVKDDERARFEQRLRPVQH